LHSEILRVPAPLRDTLLLKPINAAGTTALKNGLFEVKKVIARSQNSGFSGLLVEESGADVTVGREKAKPSFPWI
jgi:hypothetical protein